MDQVTDQMTSTTSRDCSNRRDDTDSAREGSVDLLVFGGSGTVGRLILPRLAQDHSIRIFDRLAPPEGPWNWIRGDINDLDITAVRDALKGVEAVLYLAMGTEDPDRSFHSERARSSCFDVHVKGLHLVLQCAHEAGCSHAVIASSMSVYHRALDGRFIREGESPDSRSVYGLTKFLGEEVGRFAASTWGLSVNALRLCLPQPQESWDDHAVPLHAAALSADDTADAIRAALRARDGFRAFAISGDWRQRHMDLSPAREALDWQPSRRPRAPLWSRIRSLAEPRRWLRKLTRLRG